jgi:hypothetical protein
MIILLLLAAAAPVCPAQTNLLVNGGLDTNQGFGGTPFVTTQNSGLFKGFDGWRSDLDDDGNNANNSWDLGTPGGDLFNNVYANDRFFTGADGVLPPILTGAGSAVMVGPFDSFDRNGFSGLFQQVTVVPGNTYRLTGFFISDPTQLNGSNQPDTIFANLANRNWAGMAAQFIDFLGNDVPFITVVRVLEGGVSNPAAVDGRWIETQIEVTVPEGVELVRWVGLYAQFNYQTGQVHLDNASIVNLTAGTPLRGDLDYDGVWDDDDRVMLQTALAGRLIPASNRFDIDLSGQLNQADLTLLNSLIPEPSSAYLCVVAIAAAARRRRAGAVERWQPESAAVRVLS